jgi:hypothetical protein
MSQQAFRLVQHDQVARSCRRRSTAEALQDLGFVAAPDEIHERERPAELVRHSRADRPSSA